MSRIPSDVERGEKKPLLGGLGKRSIRRWENMMHYEGAFV